MSKARAKKPKKARAAWLSPEHFAPYSEDELRELATMLRETPSPRREQEALAHPVASALLEAADSFDSVMRPLFAVFVEDEELAAVKTSKAA